MGEKDKNKEVNSQQNFNVKDYDLSQFNEDNEGITTTWLKRIALFVFEVVKVVVISLAIILPIRYFLVQPFYVQGASMEPNFYDNEYLIIDEISYRFHEPQRGEVIIFKNPENTKIYFIKRIIGLPGDNLEIKEGLVYINGQVLPEEYIESPSSKNYPLTVLATDEYFLMGDNRINSHDSRSFGPVPKDNFIGRVWLRSWPLDRINSFNVPDYSLSN